jgi:ABC-2 type transport system ATP-binding protein
MIKLERVSKSFEDTDAVDHVDLKVNRGSIYGLLGSNGAGKTTILKLLAGIYRQDGGTVMVDGQPVYENTAIKDKVFFIPDHPYFFPQYTVKQMADFYRNTYSDWSQERFEELQPLIWT